MHDRVFIGRRCRGAPHDHRVLVNDPNVSRDHAVVTLRGSRLTVRDSSRNGTRVNGERITTGVDYPLKDGDMIAVGHCRLEVDCPGLTRPDEPTDTSQRTRTITVERTVTHMVADVRGFSLLSQHLDSQRVYALMKRLYSTFTSITHTYQGTVKDYAGDAIFAIWEHAEGPDPERASAACHAALAQADAVYVALQSVRERYPDLPTVRLGWGISTGEVTLSHYGLRSDNIAVVGDSTNLAFRLSGLANKTLDSAIVMCERTAGLLPDSLAVDSLGRVATKGREGTESVFGLQGMGSGPAQGRSRSSGGSV